MIESLFHFLIINSIESKITMVVVPSSKPSQNPLRPRLNLKTNRQLMGALMITIEKNRPNVAIIYKPRPLIMPHKRD